LDILLKCFDKYTYFAAGDNGRFAPIFPQKGDQTIKLTLSLKFHSFFIHNQQVATAGLSLFARPVFRCFGINDYFIPKTWAVIRKVDLLCI